MTSSICCFLEFNDPDVVAFLNVGIHISFKRKKGWGSGGVPVTGTHTNKCFSLTWGLGGPNLLASPRSVQLDRWTGLNAKNSSLRATTRKPDGG